MHQHILTNVVDDDNGGVNDGVVVIFIYFLPLSMHEVYSLLYISIILLQMPRYHVHTMWHLIKMFWNTYKWNMEIGWNLDKYDRSINDEFSIFEIVNCAAKTEATEVNQIVHINARQPEGKQIISFALCSV